MFVVYKDRKVFCQDFKKAYTAIGEYGFNDCDFLFKNLSWDRENSRNIEWANRPKKSLVFSSCNYRKIYYSLKTNQTLIKLKQVV